MTIAETLDMFNDFQLTQAEDANCEHAVWKFEEHCIHIQKKLDSCAFKHRVQKESENKDGYVNDRNQKSQSSNSGEKSPFKRTNCNGI